MISLTVNIFYYTEEQQRLIDASIDISDDIENSNTKEHTFYNIAFIRPYGKYCEIGCDGDNFIANESYESIKQRIDEKRIYTLN